MAKNLLTRPGTFRGLITQHAVSETSNGNPQFVAVLSATEYYAETPEELEHFGLSEPGWVNWADFNEEITGYFVLFNAKGPLMNYEQLQKAVGWDGSSFEGLANGDYSTTVVLFRVEDDEYNGKMSAKVQWIDAHDASPTRQLRTFDAAALKGLDSKFAGMLNGKKNAAPARVATTPAKPALPAKPSAKDGTGTPKPSVPAAPKKAPPPPAPAKPEVSEIEQQMDEAVNGCTKEDAWASVYDKCGDAGDDAIGSAWFEVATEKAEEIGKDESEFSNADWGIIRDKTIARLSTAAASA